MFVAIPIKSRRTYLKWFQLSLTFEEKRENWRCHSWKCVRIVRMYWFEIIWVHAIPFYKKRSYKKRPIDFGFIRNEDPLNFSTIRNEKIEKPLFWQKVRNNFLQELDSKCVPSLLCTIINKILWIYLKQRDFLPHKETNLLFLKKWS